MTIGLCSMPTERSDPCEPTSAKTDPASGIREWIYKDPEDRKTVDWRQVHITKATRDVMDTLVHVIDAPSVCSPRKREVTATRTTPHPSVPGTVATL
jgi:hypothetical protein